MLVDEYSNHPLVKLLYEIITETNGSFGKNILMDPKYDNLCIDFIDNIRTDNWEDFINDFVTYKEKAREILNNWVSHFYKINKNNYTLRIDGVLDTSEYCIDYIDLLNKNDELLSEYILIMAGIDYIREQENIQKYDRVYYTLLSYFYSDSDKLFFDESLEYGIYIDKELTCTEVLQWCKYCFSTFNKYDLLLDKSITDNFSTILNRFIIVYNYKKDPIYRKILLNAIGLIYIKTKVH